MRAGEEGKKSQNSKVQKKRFTMTVGSKSPPDELNSLPRIVPAAGVNWLQEGKDTGKGRG